MKNSQKGFVKIILVILVIILASTTGYFATHKSVTSNLTPILIPTITPIVNNSNLTKDVSGGGLSIEEGSRSIPGRPESISVEKLKSGKVNVTWKPYGPDVVYHIFRAVVDVHDDITVNTPMGLVGYSSLPSYIDETPPTSPNYYYAVTAFDFWGNESRKSISSRVTRGY